MTVSKLDDSGELLNQLEKLMKRFDRNEITKDPGFFDKLFKRAKQQAEAMFKKYQTLGGEIEKIHGQFAIIEEELKQSNRELEGLYAEDVEYYFELEKYVVAAEIKLEEVTQYINSTMSAESGQWRPNGSYGTRKFSRQSKNY